MPQAGVFSGDTVVTRPEPCPNLALTLNLTLTLTLSLTITLTLTLTPTLTLTLTPTITRWSRC